MFDTTPLNILEYTEGLEAYRIDEYDLQIALEGLGKVLAAPIRFILKIIRAITDGIKKVTDKIFHRKDPKKDNNSPFYAADNIAFVPKNSNKEISIEDLLKSEMAKAEGKPDPMKAEEKKELKTEEKVKEDVKKAKEETMTKEEVKSEIKEEKKEQETKSEEKKPTIKSPEITFGNEKEKEELQKERDEKKKQEEDEKQKEREEYKEFQLEIKHLSRAEKAAREAEYRKEKLQKRQATKEKEKWEKRTNPDQRIGLFISKSKKYDTTGGVGADKTLKEKIKEIPKQINRSKVLSDYKKFIEKLDLKSSASLLCKHYETLQNEMMQMLHRIGTYDKPSDYKNANVYFQAFDRVSSQVGDKSMLEWVKIYSWKPSLGRRLKIDAIRKTVAKYIQSYPEILTHDVTHQIIAQQVDNSFYRIQTIVNSIQHHIDKFDDTYDRVLSSNNYDSSVKIDTIGSSVADLQQSLKRYGDALRTRAAALNSNTASFTTFITNLGY